MRLMRDRNAAAKAGLCLLIALAMMCSVFVITGEPAFAKAAKPGKIKTSTVKRAKAAVNSMTVSFGKSKNAKKYQVRYKKADAKKWKSVKTTKRSATLRSLKKYTKYNVQVRGINGSKKGVWSKAKTFVTLGDYHTLTFDPGVNGSLPEDQQTAQIRAGAEVGEFPWPTIQDEDTGEPVEAWFALWFTKPYAYGKQVNSNTLMGDRDMTVYAAYEFQNGGGFDQEYPKVGTAIRTKSSKLYMRILDYPRSYDHPSYALVTVLGDGDDTKVPGYLYEGHKTYYGGELSPPRLDVPWYYNSGTLNAMKNYKLPKKVKAGVLDDESFEFKYLFRPKNDVYLYAPASAPDFYKDNENYTTSESITLPDGATLQEDLYYAAGRHNLQYAINPLSVSEALKFTGGKLTGKKMQMLFNLKDNIDDSTNWCLRTPITAAYALRDSAGNTIDRHKLITYQSSTDSLQTVGLEQGGNVFARPSFVVDLNAFKFLVIDGQ